MEIYRVTVESPFTGEIQESHFFDTKENAIRYMALLRNAIGEENAQLEVLGSCYSSDIEGEFCFDHPL